MIDRWEDEVLLPAVRLALGARTDCVLFRNSTGLADTPSGSKVRYGLCKGGSDLIGTVRPSGRMICIELKSPGGKLSEDQKKFINLINLAGGYARTLQAQEKSAEGVERAIVEAHAMIDQAIATAGNWIGKTYS